jgi:hypothetical protein
MNSVAAMTGRVRGLLRAACCALLRLPRVWGMALMLNSFPLAAAGSLDVEQAARFAALALAGIDREYPNKPGAVLTGPQDLEPPRAMHPAFFGHYDWHSSVHGHWMLVRLLRLYPTMSNAAEIRAQLGEHPHNTDLEALAVRRARDFYLDDRDYPLRFEPSMPPRSRTPLRACAMFSAVITRASTGWPVSRCTISVRPGCRNESGRTMTARHPYRSKFFRRG